MKVSNYKLAVIALFVLVLLIWGGFYWLVLSVLKQNAQENANAVSLHIIDELQSKFPNIERIAFDLADESEVKEKEENIRDIFLEFASPDIAAIALIAKEKIIAANDEVLLNTSERDLKQNAFTYCSKQVGKTPFEIAVVPNSNYFDITRNNFTMATAVTVVLLTLIIGLFAYALNKNLIQILHKNVELQKQKAENVALKKQINAHFTVNVLNNIKLLAEKNEQNKITLMCDGLSFLIRYANGGEMIGGMDEMFILQKYIEIMTVRYQDKFTVDFDIDDQLDGLLLPRMLVQPILENSIIHGFAGRENGGLISLRARVESDCVEIRVIDNGCGIDEYQLQKLLDTLNCVGKSDIEDTKINSIALLNIAQRIHSYFGNEYGILINSTPGKGTEVTLRLGIIAGE